MLVQPQSQSYTLDEYRTLEEREIALESVGVSFVVKDMYEGVNFELTES